MIEIADSLQRLLIEAIDSGRLDSASLRRISVGLAPDADALHLFAADDWNGNRYEFDYSARFATLALDDWLDRIDALSLEHRSRTFYPRLLDEIATLRACVQRALRQIALQSPLLELPGCVCLMEQGFVASRSLLPVAFCHANGARELWPVKEKSIDKPAWAALGPHDITLFLPQGRSSDPYGFGGTRESPWVVELPFADIEAAWRTNRGIAIQMANEAVTREIEGCTIRHKPFATSFEHISELLAQHLENSSSAVLDDDADEEQAQALAECTHTVTLQPLELETPAVTGVWRMAAYQTIDRFKRIEAVARVDSHRFLVATTKLGLQLVDLSNRQDPSFKTLYERGDVRDVAFADEIIYAVTSDGLLLSDLDGNHRVIQKNLEGGRKHIAIYDELVAIGGEWEIAFYDRRTPHGPSFVGALAGKNFEHFVFHCGHLLVSDVDGLVVVDLGNPGNPKIVQRLVADGYRLNGPLALAGNYLFVGLIDETWVLSVETATTPQSLGVLPFSFCLGTCPPLLRGGSLHLVDEMGSVLRFEVDGALRLTQLEAVEEAIDDDGSHLIYNDYPMVWREDELVCFSEEESVVTFERQPLLEPAALKQIHRIREPLERWCTQTIKKFIPSDSDLRVGVVTLCANYGSVCLCFQGPRSRPGLEERPGDRTGNAIYAHEFPTFEISLEELIGDANEIPDDEPPENLPASARRQIDADMKGAWTSVLQSALEIAVSNDEFDRIASGRVYAMVQGKRVAPTVVDTFTFDHEWTPYRARTELAPELEIEKLLSQSVYESPRVMRRLRRRPDERAVVVELARAGNANARRVREQLLLEFPDEVLPSLGPDEISPGTIRKIGPLSEQAAVAAILDAALKGDEPARALAAREALGALEDPATITLLAALLESDDDSQVSSALDAMNALPDSFLTPLRDELSQALRGRETDDILIGRLGAALFRAGEEVPPTQVLEAAEANREMQSGMFAHIYQSILGGETAVTAAALWRGKTVAEHALAAAESATFWPPGLEYEPDLSGWKRLFRSAADYSEQKGEFDKFLSGLAERVTMTTDATAHRNLAIAAVLCSVEAPDRYGTATSLKLADRILDTSEFIDAKSLERMTYARRWGLVHRGWTALKEGDLSSVRHTVDAVLCEAPHDPGALFLDGRLRWLEEGAEACVERLRESIQRLEEPRTQVQKQAKGRVVNLLGAALHELEDYGEALPWLLSAARLDPQEPIYQANMAEVLFHLGRMAEARIWAERAREMNHHSEILEEILDPSACKQES